MCVCTYYSKSSFRSQNVLFKTGEGISSTLHHTSSPRTHAQLLLSPDRAAPCQAGRAARRRPRRSPPSSRGGGRRGPSRGLA
eukprot:233782-Prymnesium_polylepis.2